MTPEDIEHMLDEVGVPYRFHHFSTKDSVDPPFIVWNTPETNNFFADGIVYEKVRHLDIELYTDEKDWNLEEKLESILTSHEIGWEQTTSTYLTSEAMWESLYEMEV